VKDKIRAEAHNPDASHDPQGIVERFIEFCCQGIAAPARPWSS